MASSSFEAAWLARAKEITPLRHRLTSAEAATSNVARDVDEEPYANRMSQAAQLLSGGPNPGRLYETVDLQRTPRKMLARRSTAACKRLGELTADLTEYVAVHASTIRQAVSAHAHRRRGGQQPAAPPAAAALRDALDSGASSDEAGGMMEDELEGHAASCTCRPCLARLLQLNAAMSFSRMTSEALQDPRSWKRWQSRSASAAAAGGGGGGGGARRGSADMVTAGQPSVGWQRAWGRHTTDDQGGFASAEEEEGGEEYYEDGMMEDSDSAFDEDEHHVPAYMLRHHSEASGVHSRVIDKMRALSGSAPKPPAWVPLTLGQRRLSQITLKAVSSPKVRKLVSAIEGRDGDAAPEPDDPDAASRRVQAILEPYLNPQRARAPAYAFSDDSEEELFVVSGTGQHPARPAPAGAARQASADASALRYPEPPTPRSRSESLSRQQPQPPADEGAPLEPRSRSEGLLSRQRDEALERQLSEVLRGVPRVRTANPAAASARASLLRRLSSGEQRHHPRMETPAAASPRRPSSAALPPRSARPSLQPTPGSPAADRVSRRLSYPDVASTPFAAPASQASPARSRAASGIRESAFSMAALAAMRRNPPPPAAPTPRTPAAGSVGDFALAHEHLRRVGPPPPPDVPLASAPRTPSDARRLSTSSVRPSLRPQTPTPQQQQQQWESPAMLQGSPPAPFESEVSPVGPARGAGSDALLRGMRHSWAAGGDSGSGGLEAALDAELAGDGAGSLPFRWAGRLSAPPLQRRATADDPGAQPPSARRASGSKGKGARATWADEALARVNSAGDARPRQ